MPDQEWDIPLNLQPNPEDYSFDLEHALRSVVGLRVNVPGDAFTASTLGTERVGNGVVIRDDGLVLTIGYLITEAETIWLITHDGRAVPATPLAFDQASGFGLVQPLGRLNLAPLEFGDSEALANGADVILAASGGRQSAIETVVVARQEFAGYWEYVLENAIYTAPAHPFWSGAALIGSDGRLLGVGSLVLQQGEGRKRMDMNMIVPIHMLLPVLDVLLTTGRSNQPPRPWLGLYVVENDGGLLVAGISERGPAAKAGIQQGDVILGLAEDEVADLAALWRGIWATGPVGSVVPLRLSRDGRILTVPIVSSDRARFLRTPQMH